MSTFSAGVFSVALKEDILLFNGHAA